MVASHSKRWLTVGCGPLCQQLSDLNFLSLTKDGLSSNLHSTATFSRAFPFCVCACTCVCACARACDETNLVSKKMHRKVQTFKNVTIGVVLNWCNRLIVCFNSFLLRQKMIIPVVWKYGILLEKKLKKHKVTSVKNSSGFSVTQCGRNTTVASYLQMQSWCSSEYLQQQHGVWGSLKINYSPCPHRNYNDGPGNQVWLINAFL